MSTEHHSFVQTTQSSTNRIHEFDPTVYDWDDWEVLFDTYINVEGVTDDTKKRNLLITALGVQPFKTLMSICKPNKPNELSYSALILKLRSNYARVTFPSTERIKFFSKHQQSSQSLTDFANALREQTSTCAFPEDFYEEALITAFVGGLRNEHVRKHLMQKNLETFQKTIDLAKTIESVFIEGSIVGERSSDDQCIQQIQKSSKRTTQIQSRRICQSCGASDHPRDKCRFRHAICHKCQKEGHLAKICRSKSTPKQKHMVNTVCTTIVNKVSFRHPISIPIKIDGIEVNLDLDTGSPVTIINDQLWRKMGSPRLKPIKIDLNSFTGHFIHVKGEKIVNVIYDGRKFQLRLLVVEGNRNNILGRDWIEELKLNQKTLNDIISNGTVFAINLESRSLDNILNHHKELFNEGLGRCKLNAHLYVKQDAIPKFCKSRSLPFSYREAVENDLQRLVREGVLEPVSITKWAAPIVVVPKPGRKVRICADFSTGVNQALDINQYPLPRPDELFVALNGGKQFTKIDFSEAYLQIELDDDSKELLVINTHKGLFRYNRLPFGIASAPSIFQKIMDQMLAGLDGTVCYLDDIIVTGKNKEDHLKNLSNVLTRIKEYGFHINKKKCSFLQDHVEYLGFRVDKNGVHTSPSKIKAIADMPKPTNVSQLRSFLGMVNHYAKFIPKLTDRLAPFYMLLKKDSVWHWTVECDQAFKKIKQILISPLALAHYDPSIPLILAADASNSGVGAVIYHRYPDGTEKAIAHASKTLTLVEQRYAQIEKEALALVYGTYKFDQFLRGRNFTLLTDHKPLVTIFGPKKNIPTTSANRLQRWALRLMGYTYKIEYRSTNDFGQADGLSRLPTGPDKIFDNQDPAEVQVIASIQEEFQKELPLRASQIAQATQKDTNLSKVYHYVLSGWPVNSPDKLQSYFRIRDELSTSHGCILWGFRTIIPSCFRDRLLHHLHSMHSGMGRMKSSARRYFWWPSLDKDIEDLARKCCICTENTKQPAKAPLQQWNVPDQPWKRIHVDFMGKFLGNYFLVVVDAHSKWLEVIMMNNISSMETIKTLTTLFARYGLCEEIVSDNGTQFTSEEFAEFCARHGIRHIRTTPGHPQSNGQAERYVDTIKSALKKSIHNGGKVSENLQKFLFHYRSTPHSTTNVTPAELFLKRQLRTVLDLIRPNASEAYEKNRRRYQINFDRKTKKRFFKQGENVLVRDFRGSQNGTKWTSGTLIYQSGSRIWNVKVGTQIWRRHENQILNRHWSSDEDVIATSPVESQPSQEIKLSNSQNQKCDQQMPMLRRSMRKRQPVRRLIEET
ncbi:unnamed protein product [Rotaria sp. Silwood2]|nr:unnamed protein product [Rotaria sp. Silwood2]